MNQDVAEIAKEWFEKHEPEGYLASVIIRCFFFGSIIRRPGFLLMGETSFWDGKTIWVAPPEKANAWFLYFWCSTKPMSSYELCLEAPFPLTYVAFKRRGKYKVLEWKKLYEKDIGYRARHYVSA
jgi:hypothetical protein